MSPERVRVIAVGMVIFILSVAIHEFGHAFVADRLGDRLPRAQGRVTLNPMAHAHPIGTLLLPFIFLATTGSIGFAWGKPVEHTTHDRKRRLFISFAGPFMNVVLAALSIAVAAALVRFGHRAEDSDLVHAIKMVVLFNFTMFFFNLIPSAPLDGGSVVRGLIPESWVDSWDEYSKYGWVVLLLFLMTPRLGVIIWGPSVHATNFLIHAVGLQQGFVI